MKATPKHSSGYSSHYSPRHFSSRPYKKTTVALLLLLSYICLTAGQVSAKLAGSVMQLEEASKTIAVDNGTGNGAGGGAVNGTGGGIDSPAETGNGAGSRLPARLRDALSGPKAASLAITFALGTYVFFLLRGLLWVFLLRKLKLVLAYPLMSIGYVLVLGISFLFFNETLTVGKMVGALLLMTGVSLVSYGEVRQKKAAEKSAPPAAEAKPPLTAEPKPPLAGETATPQSVDTNTPQSVDTTARKTEKGES